MEKNLTNDELQNLIQLAGIAENKTNDYYHDLKVLDINEVDDFAMEANPATISAMAQELIEARAILEFYSKGGIPNWDVSIIGELGYFTGKRARAHLAKWRSEEYTDKDKG